MKKIEVALLNPEAIKDSAAALAFGARLTQKGHKLSSMDDCLDLYEKPITDATRANMVALPHPTLQKFGVLNVLVHGASRRFLAQITRHQNEVKFMSASLQYSDYSSDADFVIPYELLSENDPVVLAARAEYLMTCKGAMDVYEGLIAMRGMNNDTAGYLAPQGLRNVLLISATPFQWRHMISQRTCRRNTDETRIVMLMIWQHLHMHDPIQFPAGDDDDTGQSQTCGPFCMQPETLWTCPEGKMQCGRRITAGSTPLDILQSDYPVLFEED